MIHLGNALDFIMQFQMISGHLGFKVSLIKLTMKVKKKIEVKLRWKNGSVAKSTVI